MKKLYSAFFVIICLSSIGFAQSPDCTVDDDVEALVRNFRCVGDPGDRYLQFDLTFNINGTPAMLLSTGVTIYTLNGTQLGRFMGPAPEPEPYVNKFFNLSVGNECFPINALFARPEGGISCNPILEAAPAAPIPTLGQWAIICLGFIISVFGILTIRKRVNTVSHS